MNRRFLVVAVCESLVLGSIFPKRINAQQAYDTTRSPKTSQVDWYAEFFDRQAILLLQYRNDFKSDARVAYDDKDAPEIRKTIISSQSESCFGLFGMMSDIGNMMYFYRDLKQEAKPNAQKVIMGSAKIYIDLIEQQKSLLEKCMETSGSYLTPALTDHLIKIKACIDQCSEKLKSLSFGE